MMTAFDPNDIVFDDESYYRVPKLIKKPKTKRKQKKWWPYYEWWLGQQFYTVWFGCDDFDMPYKREKYIYEFNEDGGLKTIRIE
jgi:hypothetical protein